MGDDEEIRELIGGYGRGRAAAHRWDSCWAPAWGTIIAKHPTTSQFTYGRAQVVGLTCLMTFVLLIIAHCRNGGGEDGPDGSILALNENPLLSNSTQQLPGRDHKLNLHQIQFQGSAPTATLKNRHQIPPLRFHALSSVIFYLEIF